jgi:hypothetical protein
VTAERYTVKIVFRGLCMARKGPNSASLDVYLPDLAEVPQPTAEQADADPRKKLLRGAGPFREHYAVLEFLQSDWDNQSKLVPRLVQLQKPTKAPVGLYMLRGQRIHFRGLYGGRDARAQRPELDRLAVDEERYSRLGELFFLDSDDQYGFDQLAGYRGELADDAPAKCAALVSLAVGEARTERRSTLEGQAMFWQEVLALDKTEVVSPRTLNLDIVVRFTLPRFNPLLVTCEPFAMDRMVGDEVTFVLRPPEGSSEVTVWVKNREISAILFDSDADPDPFPAGCPPHRDDLDRDLALLAVVARNPERVTIPRRALGDASDCGSGCGCSQGGGP